MSENEKVLSEKELQKQKIRERYKGLNTDDVEVIPARKKADFYDDIPRRVAVYVRVSTDDPRQTSSYELQKNYYEDFVQKHPSWTLVGIYADEGISGTSLNHRENFKRMLADCRAGKIDMIITKSVSRFARNIVDCISIARELLALRPAVGVFFETEHIFTLKDDTEMQLSFVATMAQEESHTKSKIMNTSLDMRFSHGILLTPTLLGYDHDEKKELIINDDEAQIVRLIFFMYLFGCTCKQISETLEKLGCKTKIGNETWSAGSILQILKNERYCGDVLTWKTYTPNYIDHKSKRNKGDRTQHRWRDHHEAIISRDDFIAVQHLIANAKYGNKGILPELQVIKDGALKGYISVNPRWSGFKIDDYISACRSVDDYEEEIISEPIQITAEEGEFDLRGFEVARAQFFDTPDRMCVTFSDRELKFSSACIKKLGEQQYIELLVHPLKRSLVVRTCSPKAKNAFRWAKMDNRGVIVPRGIAGSAFIKTLYKIFGWDSQYKYRIRGIRKQKDDLSIITFDTQEVEVFLSTSNILTSEEGIKSLENVSPIAPKTKTSIVAYPSAWGNNFGNNFYTQAQAIELAEIEDGINIAAEPFENTRDFSVPTPEVIESNIKQIINEIGQEENPNGYNS